MATAAESAGPAGSGGTGRVSDAGARRYAREWARAAVRSGFVPLGAAETERLLLTQTVRLAQALLAQPFSTVPAGEVGRALVAANLSDPALLDWSVRALGERFVSDVLPDEAVVNGTDGVALGERVAGLQGTLAAGFATALRQSTFAQQERIARSAWQARDSVEQALRDSEARFRAVFTGAVIGIGIADVYGRIVDVNRPFAELLGYSVAELRQINVSALFQAENATGVWEIYRDLVEGRVESARAEKRYYRRDGNIVWADLAVSLIRHEDGRPRFIVAMAEDITERIELQQRLRFQATHDPLTGLPNRTLFFDRLGALSEIATPADRIGICFLDLDGFKAINDTLGHDLGDQLLVEIAGRLAGCVAGQGHLVARMGGDEFVILVAGSEGPADVTAVAETVLDAVATPVQLGDQKVTVSASIGIVERPVRGSSAAELMKAADTTLYWAKAEGRGRWAVHDPERSARDIARSALAARLPVALERDEFTVDFQPIVALTDGDRMHAVEALVRWRHPEGLLGPDQFIGLAEETGHIVRLGRWVLRNACESGARWLRDFPDAQLMVSVNLAVRQLSDPDLVATVSETLAATGLPPELLQLELTESAVMAPAGEPLRALRRLAALGVRLAIDDFGTGYSNLAYLRRLPVRTLKLAAPFVEGIRSEGRSRQTDERILDALIRLAHALGLSVTAEGVETAGQSECLRDLCCDTGQGRFFGPPVGGAEITARLARCAAGGHDSRRPVRQAGRRGSY